MKKFLFLIPFILISCSDTPEIVLSTPGELTTFTFTKDLNPTLTSDLVLTFDGVDTFTGTLNYRSAIESLVATFTYAGGDVFVQNTPQISAVTENNFNQVVAYTVFNSGGSSSRNYYIDISYFTVLPIISINTNGVPIVSKEEYVEGTVSIEGGGQFENIETQEMKIKGRGNSTWFGPPKKPYQLKLSDKTAILGMPEDKKWLLLAEYSDKSLIRNKISLELGAMSELSYTPKSEYAEVFLNDEYNGTYLITQKVEVKSNRLDLPDNGYLIEIDQNYRLDADDVFFQPIIFTQNYTENVFALKEPSVDFGSPELALIEDHINAFEAALFGSDFKDPTSGYQAFIDLPSFVDWYLIQEIAKSVDAKWYSSIYFNYVPGGKIKMGPLWDFDLSYGNVDYADATYSEGFWIKENPWDARLFLDPYFENLVKQRFLYFYNNTDYLLEKIDNHENYLELAQARNYQKWQTLGIYVWPNPVYFDTHAEEVDHLKSWLTNRMNWLYGEFN
jgi:hypothetical protein